MTIKKCTERIEAIRVKAAEGDFERARIMEARLHVDVLRAISAGKAARPKVLATKALETRKIPMS